MTKKDKVERPWLNLRVDGKSVLLCKNAELIEEKIINNNFAKSFFSITLAIDGSIYWLYLPKEPKKLTIKRVVNKALRTHAGTDITMQIYYSRPRRVFGMDVHRRDNARAHKSFRSTDPESIVYLIRSEIYPFHSRYEMTFSISGGDAPWGRDYTLPCKDHWGWNKMMATSAGMCKLNKHFRQCIDLHKSFFNLPETG